MTTNDKPVCKITGIDEYGPILAWHKHWVDVGVGAMLYARPQPAAPQVPEGWVINVVGNGIRVASPVSGPGATVTHHNAASLTERLLNALAADLLATPPAPEQPACTQRGECDCIGQCKHGRGGNGAEQPKPAIDDVGLLSLAVGYYTVAREPRAPEVREAFGRIKARLSTKPAGDDAGLAEWLEREMPAGTVIGDPRWWAERIAARLSAKPAGDVEALASECGVYYHNGKVSYGGPLYAFTQNELHEFARRLAAQPAQGEGEK